MATSKCKFTNDSETKIERVFKALMDGRSFNRFDAERQLHDHCLHSTVSEIQKRYRVEVVRKFETVPGYQGQPVRCCRYWITPEERMRIEIRRLCLRHKKSPNHQRPN